MRIKPACALVFLSVMIACAAPSGEPGARTETPEEAVSLEPLDFRVIREVVGLEGTEQGGQYKVAVPQHELSVSVDGFKIIPPMGLTSWAAFAPNPEGAIVMGDLVVRENEVGPVEETLIASGLTISGLHNHFVRDREKAMFMHIHGTGSLEELSQGVRATLDKIKELRQMAGLTSESSQPVKMTFDSKTIDQILGHSGSMNDGVYKITVGRPDVSLMDHGTQVTTFMGFNTWMAFQGTAEKAAVAGDFTMLENEVAGVIEALVKNNIEVVAVHNHMTMETPKVYFLHFWGVGPVENLARGLIAGLDQTGS